MALPPDLVRLGGAHRSRQQRIALAVLRQLARLWAALDPASVRPSWDRAVGPAVLRLTTAAQLEAARGTQDYVTAAMGMWGAESDPFGTVPAGAFAGTASDGRPLGTLLLQPALDVEAFIGQGMAADRALAVGSRHLTRIAATQVQDAARVATGVAIVNDRKTHGWIRMVTPPSCSRCVVLAGKFYRYRQGFQRHPHCDCVHMPAPEVIEPQSPKALFDAMSPAELKRAGWSEADVKAINDGADLYQVTNARRDLRSMTVAGRQVQTTLQGSTRRGLAGKRLGAQKGGRAVRLTPEQIYAEADRLGWPRDEVLRQLKRFGFIL